MNDRNPVIRDREPSDRDALLRLVRVVHESDDYPARLPGDLGAFVYDPGAAGAWVSATDEGAVVGHVALHRHSTPGVLDLASEALDRQADDLLVVARLLVHPDYRRRGVGAALLGHATAAARRSGARAILDVATHYAAAIALYERVGWLRIGTVTADIGLGAPLQEHVYVAPPD